jgi:hypothetical protein
MVSKPTRSRSLLLSSGINFFAGFITGITFLHAHNNVNVNQNYDDTLASLPPLIRYSNSIRVPIPIPPMEDSSPLPMEDSRLLSVESRTSAPIPPSVPPMEDSSPLPMEDSRLLSVESRTSAPIPPFDEEVFPESMKSLFHRMGRVSRGDFAEKFDIGYGIDKSFRQNDEVLILYGSENSLPTNYSMDGSTVVPQQRISDATENCDVMKIIVMSPKPKRPKSRAETEYKQCTAIMGNWESHHVHKWKRRERKGIKELEYVPAQRVELPSREETRASNSDLQAYLSVYEDAREKLRPVADKVARGGNTKGKLGPIIVMVANHGQSQFFINFVCAAKSRGLDISRVLLFATDQETYHLAESMGIAVFYDDRVFASIPSGAAKDYHDMNYGRIMMSKVYCVHLINSMGYDLLFQDLDIVWYKNPLEYFKTTAPQNFDMYFQHDGNHHPERFAPLAANTGFYYVRHNERTEHFFSVFVRMGDLVIFDKSHQAAMSTLANEHMSLRGLRVKVLAKEMDMFPSK